VYTVEGYETDPNTGDPVLDVGRLNVNPDDVDGVFRAAKRAEANLSFDEWPDDINQRKSMIKSAVKETVPKGQDDVRDRTIRNGQTPEIDDGTFEKAADTISSVLANTNQPEAETILSRISSVGDDIPRAHAGDSPGKNRPRAYMDISEGQSQDVIKHELGHNFAQSFGFGNVDSGASADRNYFPGGGDDVDLSSDGDIINTTGRVLYAEDPVEQHTVGYSNAEVAEAAGVDFDSDESTSVGRSDWEDKVRDEIPDEIVDFSARNFRNADNEYLFEAEEGDMIRTDGPKRFGRHLAIKEINEDPSGGPADREFVAEDNSGNEQVFGVERTMTDYVRITKVRDIEPDQNSPAFDVAGKRQSTPDAFGDSEPDIPDPDDVLGGEPADTPQERMREFVSVANQAWFRANLSANRHGKQENATMFNIRDGYSTTTAHETIAQTVEMMQTTEDEHSAYEINSTAKRLVNNNPELIEKYRHIADISDTMQRELNNELQGADTDFRLGDN
jgi:hypothetical protein